MYKSLVFNFGCSFYQQKMDNAHVSSDVNLDEFEGSGTKVWVGKDYCNFIFKDFVDLDKPFTGNFSFVLLAFI